MKAILMTAALTLVATEAFAEDVQSLVGTAELAASSEAPQEEQPCADTSTRGEPAPAEPTRPESKGGMRSGAMVGVGTFLTTAGLGGIIVGSIAAARAANQKPCTGQWCGVGPGSGLSDAVMGLGFGLGFGHLVPGIALIIAGGQPRTEPSISSVSVSFRPTEVGLQLDF